MAEPADTAVLASSPPVADRGNAPKDLDVPGNSFPASASRTSMSSSFQAINARATPIDGAARVSTAASPPNDTAVAHNAIQSNTSAHAANDDRTVSQMEDLDASMTVDAATYGTRSRNRTGNSRPNYAEDQDMDFEYSNAATTSKKRQPQPPNDTSAAAAAAAATPTTTEARRAQDFARFVAVNGSGSQSNGSATKESTPGTPGVAANLSKKRKAAGAQPAITQTPPPASSAASNATRKLPAPSAVARETNIMTFTRSRSCLNKKGELVADDGTKLCVDDHVYLVCEPAGDPYYLCRIMEFLHARSDDPTSPVDSLRVNWYYRPRDVQRFNNDSRLLYGTMHSDMCPLSSLRGKCTIKHRSEIEDLDAYRKERDSFYFVQIFDRFIRRWYECIPVSQIINVPEKVKKALDERWKFAVVEVGKVKELTSDVKTCKRCAKYCATNDSVDCAICKNSYHMNCVQPPLPKKPSRGFAWACGPCSRASEKKLEARNTPTVSGDVTEVEEEEPVEEELPSASNDTTRAPSPSGSDAMIDIHPATQAEIESASMWPMRYLGIHCRVEDALQYDDRAIYPRASSRLGPRHQVNVLTWPGRPVELVKPADVKKRFAKNSAHKKDPKLAKEALAAAEADREERAKRPKWLQDEPPGYIARGEDYPADDPRNTAKLMFKMPETNEPSGSSAAQTAAALAKANEIAEYIKRAKPLARGIGVPPFGTNFLDKALELLTDKNFDQEAALEQLKRIHRVHDLHEPVLSKQELLKFEEGVAKFGSEHRSVRLHMKTNLPNSDIIRFYYLWKKTPKGKEIWGNFGGRKGSKQRKLDDNGALLQQSVANEGDDSAFDNEKAIKKSRGFQCKFCNTSHSRQWRKAPGVSPGQTVPVDAKNVNNKSKPLLLALCLRCAGLWRKYAIQWEDVDEVAKKVAAGGGRAWKRRIDEELLRELMAANDAANAPQPPEPAVAAVPSIETGGEPLKKKYKTDAVPPAELIKKTVKPPPPPKEPTPPPPPIIPNQPQWRALPCAVCHGPDDTISCCNCKLTVHRRCFGLGENEGLRPDGEVRWICEQCSNDRNPQVSTDYTCCLCLTEETLIELVEPPRVSHKKKTDREREKERLEKELADAMRAEYRAKQLSMNRPQFPREPLKRTTGNNWVHVYCAVWMPEIRFSDSKALEVAEGFQNIPLARLEAVCKLCKNKDHQNRFRYDKGACVGCFQCHSNVHISCAFEAGYIFGFDVTPVKGSRKDQITTVTLGEETGSLAAGIWCKEHVTKNVVHAVNEPAGESGQTAMQVYVENYKQADLTLTGTIRKANLAQLMKDKVQQAPQQAIINGSRRESTANSIAAAVRRGARTSSAADARSEAEDGSTQISDIPETPSERRCMRCNIDVTPKWHPAGQEPVAKEPTPPKSPEDRKMLNDVADSERTSPSQQPRQNAQNIRFMPPGASGRAWEGMPDRYSTPRTAANGERDQAAPGSHSSSAPGPAVNGNGNGEGPRRDPDDVFHSHTLPQYQSPAMQQAPAAANVEMETNESKEFLCHKCFLKRKLDPTPPPEERPAHHTSPPFAPSSGGWGTSSQPPSQAIFDANGNPRMPWDDPPPAPPQPPLAQVQPPPPQPPSVPPPVNGLGLSLQYGPPHPQQHQTPHPPQQQQHQQHHPQHHTQSYQHYGQQPNGYSVPPPPTPQSMHERSGSYGYASLPPPPPPPVQSHYQQHGGPPSHSPMQGYPPQQGHHHPQSHTPSQGHHPPQGPPHMTSSVASQHTQSYPPLQSPTRQHAPPPPPAPAYHHPGYGQQQGRTESPYAPSQLPPYDPRNSAGARMSENLNPQPPPPLPPQSQQLYQQPQAHQQAQTHQQPQAHQQPQTNQPVPQHMSMQTQTHSQTLMGAPHVNQSRPASQAGPPPPGTPAQGAPPPPPNGTQSQSQNPVAAGASASPSLRNLLS